VSGKPRTYIDGLLAGRSNFSVAREEDRRRLLAEYDRLKALADLVQTEEDCPHCIEHPGKYWICDSAAGPCPHCHGTGKIMKDGPLAEALEKAVEVIREWDNDKMDLEAIEETASYLEEALADARRVREEDSDKS